MALKHPAAASLRLARIAFLLVAVSPLLLAAPRPAWWTTRGAISPQQPADDYAIANLGQLKQMAAKARDELNSALLNQGGAGPAIDALIASFGVNLARLPGVAAAQSSTYNDPAANPSAAKAIDGNTEGNYARLSVAHTSSEASPWWQIDLGASRLIQSVEIWNRTDAHSGRLINFYVLVSDSDMRGANPSAPRSLSSLLADGAVWKSAKVTTPPAPNLRIQAGSRIGRYVMIRLEGSEYLQLAEVKVLGVANPGAPPADDFAAATLGQLKAVAKPFYDRLSSAGYRTSYPWLGREAAADDLAIANLGQLKNLFSFDLSPLDSTRDTNSNKVPDWWEHLYLGRLIAGSGAGSAAASNAGPASDQDSDGDGLSDIQEYLAGSNPNTADTDGDGLSDAEEAAAGTNPNSSDTDHDGLSDAEEIALGTNPNSPDTDQDGVNDKLDLYPLDPRRSRDIPILHYAAIDVSTPITQNEDIMMVAVDDSNRVGFARKDVTNSMYESFSVPQGSQGAGVERHQLPFEYDPGMREMTYFDEGLDKKLELLIIQKYVYDVQAVNSKGTFTGLLGLNATAYRKPLRGDFPPPGEAAVLGPIPGKPQYNILYDSYGGAGLLKWRGVLWPAMASATLYPFSYTMEDYGRYGHGITNDAGICWGNDHENDFNTFIGGTIFGPASGAANRRGFNFDSWSSMNSKTSQDGSCAAGTQEGSSGSSKACWIKGGFYSIFGSPDTETEVKAIDNEGEIFGFSPKFKNSSYFAHREALAEHAFWFSGGVIGDFYSALPEAFQQQVAFMPYHQAVESPSYRGAPTLMNSLGDLLFTATVADTQDATPVWRRALLLWTRARNGSAAQLNEVELPEGFDLRQINSRLFFAGLLKKPVLNPDGTPRPDPANPAQPLKSNRAALLFPVEFVDTKNKVLDDSDDVQITPKQNVDDKNMKSIAWIEPHGSEDTLDAPDMPQLVLRFRETETMGLKIKWKLKVEHKRRNGRVVAGDKVEIPWVEEPLDAAVKIFANQKWKDELKETVNGQEKLTRFFGGDAELTYQLLKSDGTALGSEEKMLFYIGGRNPDDAKCKEYINTHTTSTHGNMWFCYAIAKSESKDYNGAGSRYNQFWDKHGSYGRPPNRTDHHAGEVLWVDTPGEDPPKGFGIFQVTGDKDDQTVNIPREQLWNWQRNTDAAITIIRDKRDRMYAGAWDYLNGTMKEKGSRTTPRGRRQQALQDTGSNVPMPVHTVRRVTFQDATNRVIEDAENIRLYNGGHYILWDRSTKQWKFSMTNKFSFNYVDRVCQEVE